MSIDSSTHVGHRGYRAGESFVAFDASAADDLASGLRAPL